MKLLWPDSEYNSTLSTSVADLLLNVPPAPCEIHNCPNVSRCQDRKLACQAFQDFVKVGEAATSNPNVKENMLNPTREIFNILFPNDDGSMTE